MTSALLVAWLSCQTFDLTTTAIAVRAGHVETNGIVRGRRLYPLKIGVNVGAFIWHRRMDSNVRKNILAGMFAAGGCVPGAINLRRLQRDR